MESESFIRGILEKIQDIAVFLNPLTNSYANLGDFKAPKYIYMVSLKSFRILAAINKKSLAKLHSLNSACNPYIAFVLLLYAGLEKIEKKQLPHLLISIYIMQIKRHFTLSFLYPSVLLCQKTGMRRL